MKQTRNIAIVGLQQAGKSTLAKEGNKMSGGFFSYNQFNCHTIAEEINELIKSNNKEDDYGDAYNYPDEIIEKFKETRDLLIKCGNRVQRIDWLVSGDDGEESFFKRWKEENCDL